MCHNVGTSLHHFHCSLLEWYAEQLLWRDVEGWRIGLNATTTSTAPSGWLGDVATATADYQQVHTIELYLLHDGSRIYCFFIMFILLRFT